MRLLDLFCGAGGAAMGYHRAGFTTIHGVDIKPQPRFPFTFICADAMTFPLEGYDLIHASPPCQGYIQRNKNLVTKWPKLIEPLRERLQRSGIPYIIENVEGAPLQDPITLCGTMFDLPIRRHRLFEGVRVDTPKCNHWGTVAHGQFAAVYAKGGKGPRHGRGVREPASRTGAPSWEVAMGIDWMIPSEITQAIPPAYTEWIGRTFK